MLMHQEIGRLKLRRQAGSAGRPMGPLKQPQRFEGKAHLRRQITQRSSHGPWWPFIGTEAKRPSPLPRASLKTFNGAGDRRPCPRTRTPR